MMGSMGSEIVCFHQILRGVSSPTKVKEPQPGGSLGPLQVCEYMISVKMNHFPRAWASQQPLPCFWGQNIMLGRVISILMLGPRSSKTSSLAWLTLVAKALSSRSERKLPSFQRHHWSWKTSGSERKINDYYSLHTMKKRVSGVSTLSLKLCILSRGRKGERLNLRIKCTGFFWLGKVREDQDREGAELVFLFSHSVLWKGCLTGMEKLFKKRRVRLKAVCSLAKGWKPFLPTACPFSLPRGNH